MKDLERFVPKYEVDGKVVSDQFNDLMDENPDLPGTERAKEIVASAVEGRKFTASSKGEADAMKANGFKGAQDRLRRMGEFREQDAIRKEMERLYLEHNPEEKAAIQDRDEIAVAKAIHKSRGMTKAEAAVVLEEAELVGRFVEGFGIKPKDQETTRKTTLALNKEFLPGDAFEVEVGLGGNQYAILGKSIFKGGLQDRIGIDHELFHTYQSSLCPGPLVEGTTCLYTEAVQPTEKRKKKFPKEINGNSYKMLYKICNNYQDIVGKDALAKAYFEGDMSDFLAVYKERVGSTESLEKQFDFIEKARKTDYTSSFLKFLFSEIPMFYFEQAALRMSKKDLKKAKINRENR